MKTSPDHLPPSKQRELEHVVAVLTEEFEKARVKGDQLWRRSGKILKIILFGSFARGDWVDDPDNGYQSDWDLLFIVNHERLTAIEDLWWEGEERLLKDEAVKRPVNVIVHTLAQVNQALKQGGYFWIDVLRDGVMLFERPRYQLATPLHLAPADAYATATRYFDLKFKDSLIFLETVLALAAKGREDATYLRHAAFNLHQAVETAYGCFLLVRTLYLPKSHNIKFLRAQSEALDRRLIAAWPREARKDRARYELLKRAYVEARYSEHFTINEEDLRLLTHGAQTLIDLVDQACRGTLEDLRRKAEEA